MSASIIEWKTNARKQNNIAEHFSILRENLGFGEWNLQNKVSI